MDKPQIYVACLAAYNHGILHGKWIDACQIEDEIMAVIQKMLADSPIEHAEEFALHDYEGFGTHRFSEYESIESVASYAAFIVEHEELGQALLSEYDLDEAESMMNDAYQGSYDSEIDFAWQLFEDCYSNVIPDNLMCYFDCEAFARELFINDVRHEVAIQTVAAGSHLKATYCSVSSSLPGHATRVIWWCEALGTMKPRETVNESVRISRICQH